MVTSAKVIELSQILSQIKEEEKGNGSTLSNFDNESDLSLKNHTVNTQSTLNKDERLQSTFNRGTAFNNDDIKLHLDLEKV